MKFKIASLNIKRELVKAATDIAQVYDQYQYSNCLKRQELPKRSPERTTLIMEGDKNERKLLEFLVILKMAELKPAPLIEKSIADWIASNTPEKIKQEAPPVIVDNKTRKLLRKLPPQKELNKIEGSIDSAKAVSDNLKAALKKPRFDVSKVHNLIAR